LALDQEARRVFVLCSTNILSEQEYCELSSKAILGGVQFHVAADVMLAGKITLILQEGRVLD